MKLTQAVILLTTLTFTDGAGLRKTIAKHRNDARFEVANKQRHLEEALDPTKHHPLYKTFAGLSEEEIDAALFKRDTSIKRELMVAHDKHFRESDCNIDVDAEACVSIDNFLDPDSEVKIPCGVCATIDKYDGTTLDFQHGLNVVGKLHIPSDASFTIKTKYLLVQGVLRMDPPPAGSTLPRAGGEKVRFQLYGNETISFFPDGETDNVMACGMEEDMTPKACTIGIKPFAVAGGEGLFAFPTCSIQSF